MTGEGSIVDRDDVPDVDLGDFVDVAEAKPSSGSGAQDGVRRGPGRPPGRGKTMAERLATPEAQAEYDRLRAEGLSDLDILQNCQATRASQTIAVEQPAHRIMVMLRAQGLSHREIADHTGYNEVAVGNILRQPWAKARLVQMLADAGKDPLVEMLRGEVMNSVFTLMEVRDNAGEKGATRVAAARELLDRSLGKSVQRTENINVNATPDDLDSLNKEIAAARAAQAKWFPEPATSEASPACVSNEPVVSVSDVQSLNSTK